MADINGFEPNGLTSSGASLDEAFICQKCLFLFFDYLLPKLLLLFVIHLYLIIQIRAYFTILYKVQTLNSFTLFTNNLVQIYSLNRAELNKLI